MNSCQIIFVLITYLENVICISQDDFYVYGYENGDTRAPTNDDGSTSPIPVGSLFPFFNHQHDSLIVNTNGVISFLGTMSTYTPTPFPLGSRKRLIAPFWADVDTRNGGDVWYRETTNSTLLQMVSEEIRTVFPEQHKFQATWGFIATWSNVAFYGADDIGKKKRCTFQCLLISNGRHSFTVYLYDKIEWTTGRASSGNRSTGLGGTPAQVGFDAGDGVNYFALAASRKPEIINVTSMSNVNIPGKLIFRVDSAGIKEVVCNMNGTLGITPKEASMFGGTLLVISGPCFRQTDSVSLVMSDVKSKVNCEWLSEYSVTCISPPLYRTGSVMVQFRVILHDNQTFTFSSFVTIVNPAMTTSIISRHPEIWKHEAIVEVYWNTNEMNFPSNLPVNIDLYYPKIDNKSSAIRLVHHTSLPTPNATGNYSFQLNYPIQAGIIRISVNDSNSPYYWSDMFTVLVNISTSIQVCDDWKRIDMTLPMIHHNDVTSCPCTLQVALLDLTTFHVDPLCVNTGIDIYDCNQQPFAKLCFKQNLPTPQGYDNQCCYDDNGVLMNPHAFFGSGYANRYHSAGDNLDNIPFLSNFLYDVVPYQHCCVYPIQDVDSVDINVFSGCEVFYTRRPPNSCLNYKPPVVGRVSGDPHFVTLDGLLYTFNAVGEFVAIATDNFTLQLRLEQYGDSHGSSVTSFTGRSHDNADVIEVQTNTIRGIDVLINGELADFEVSISKTISVRGAVIESTSGDQPSVTVTFERPHLSVKAYAVLTILNLLIMISPSESEFVGLFGNHDGLSHNDLVSRSGELINSNASMIDIHNRFGLSWAISESESLFTYPNGRPFSSYQNQNFNPAVIIPEHITDPAIVKVCGTNYECIYDYYVTGDKELGEISANSSDKFEVITNITMTAVSCGFPYNISNAVWIADGYTEGSTATLQCGNGYYPANILTSCSANGSWLAVDFMCTPLPDCGQPPSVSDAFWEPGSNSGGQSATLKCNDGFYLYNVVQISCTSNNTWTNINDICMPECKDPYGVTNGVWLVNGYQNGSQAELLCNQGYYSSIPVILRCDEFGHWDDNNATCALESTTESTSTETKTESTAESTPQRIMTESTAESTLQRITTESTAELAPQQITTESTSESTAQQITTESTAESTAQQITTESTAESTPQQITAESTPESTPQQIMTESTAESTPQHITTESTSESTSQQITTESTSESTPQQITAESTSESTPKQITTESTAESMPQQMTESTAESTPQQITTESTAESTQQITVESTSESTPQQIMTESTAESTQQIMTESTAESTPQQIMTESTAESTPQQITTESTAESTPQQIMTESTAESTSQQITTKSTSELTTEQQTESTTQQKRITSRIMIEATSQYTITDSIMKQSPENLKTEAVDKTSLIVGIVVSVIGILFIIIVLKIITLKYRRQNSGYEMNKPHDENVCDDLPKWVNGPTLYTEPTIEYLPISSLCFENLTYTQSKQDGTEEEMDN